MQHSTSRVIAVWLRRDLRLFDNHALYKALLRAKQEQAKVLPVFIFDRDILDKLEDKDDRRVNFLHEHLSTLKAGLQIEKRDICVRYGNILDVWSSLIKDHSISAIYSNHDDEPYAKARDQNVRDMADSQGIDWQDFKDHLIFERDEVTKDDGKPYTVFTPYSKKWRKRLEDEGIPSYPAENNLQHLLDFAEEMPSLESMGFQSKELIFPEKTAGSQVLKDYNKHRNFPSVKGTTRLGIHLRFGTISIRHLLQQSEDTTSFIFTSELIWRDFYAQILSHFPYVSERAFRPAYDEIAWRNAEDDFDKWCKGETGYSLVDAGMKELLTTGFMHNRVRMLVASFLTKHLLIDWRWGEAWFARHLLDFDLASNNGGWQWASGSGTDAAPYFRIFNPITQADKFDKDGKYRDRFNPGWRDGKTAMMVDHRVARERALITYKARLSVKE
ncbi:MAG TPA: deoxyribodipyrimidine photolyase [Bacteroidetes bacterium]|nr:deoxyribodipyrimidine photolyase [Bacteroidota bacterium]